MADSAIASGPARAVTNPRAVSPTLVTDVSKLLLASSEPAKNMAAFGLGENMMRFYQQNGAPGTITPFRSVCVAPGLNAGNVVPILFVYSDRPITTGGDLFFQDLEVSGVKFTICSNMEANTKLVARGFQRFGQFTKVVPGSFLSVVQQPDMHYEMAEDSWQLACVMAIAGFPTCFASGSFLPRAEKWFVDGLDQKLRLAERLHRPLFVFDYQVQQMGGNLINEQGMLMTRDAGFLFKAPNLASMWLVVSGFNYLRNAQEAEGSRTRQRETEASDIDATMKEAFHESSFPVPPTPDAAKFYQDAKAIVNTLSNVGTTADRLAQMMRFEKFWMAKASNATRAKLGPVDGAFRHAWENQNSPKVGRVMASIIVAVGQQMKPPPVIQAPKAKQVTNLWSNLQALAQPPDATPGLTQVVAGDAAASAP